MNMKRTTVLADDELILDVKHLARQEGTTLTEIVQRALREYVERHRARRQLSFIGIGESGRDDVSERVEDLLWTSTEE